MRSSWKWIALIEGLLLLAILAFLREEAPERPAEATGIPLAPASSRNAPLPAPELSGPAGAAREPSSARTALPGNPADSEKEDLLGLILYGRITDGQGRTLHGASVEILDDEGHSRTAYVAPDEDGYHVFGLRGGHHRFTVRAKGYENLEGEIEIAGAPGRQRRDFQLRKAAVIRVRFETPTGKDLISELKATLSPDSGTIPERSFYAVATTQPPPAELPVGGAAALLRFGVGSWQGRWFLSDLPADLPERWDGILSLKKAPPVLVSAVFRGEVVQTLPLPPGVEELVFTIPLTDVLRRLASLRLQVVDLSSGEGIPGAVVTLTDSQTGRFGGPKTGPDGRISIPQLRPGLMDMKIRAQGYGAYHRWLRLRPGEEQDLGVIRLAPPTTLCGRVVDLQGNPIPGARWSWDLLIDVGFRQPPQALAVNTDAEGRIDAFPVPRGKLRIRAWAKGYASAVVLADTSAGPVAGIELRLARPVDFLFDLSSASGSSYRLWILNPQGLLVLPSRQVGRSPIHLDLAPGSYSAVVEDPSGAEIWKGQIRAQGRSGRLALQLP